jgi:tight adherence protein B
MRDMNPQQLVNLVLMGSVFVLVFSGWTICVVWWTVQYSRRRKRLQRRMGYADDEARRTETLQLWRDDYQARRAALQRKKETLKERLARLGTDAGWKSPAHSVILSVMGLMALAVVVPMLLGYSVLIGVAIAAAILVVFWTVTGRRIDQRAALFDRQFMESLGIAARALRAGHPLVGAFQSIAEEIGEPVGSIFGEICQEQALGLDLQDSIRRVADVARNADLKLFATAVSIQMTSGGNLADVMDSLASVMRARIRLNRRVRVLTTESRMSRDTLLALPPLLFLAMNILSPQYVSIMYNTFPGKIMLVGTVISMLFGAWTMSRLSVIRY